MRAKINVYSVVIYYLTIIMKKISIVIPCYNEEKNLLEIHSRIKNVFSQISEYNYEIIFVNDGSVDKSQELLENLSSKFDEVKFIEFSRNFGGQIALKAGLDNSNSDAVITIDADLQHPPELIPEMIKFWEEGYDVVNMYRKYSSDTSFFKKKTSDIFYSLLSSISDINMKKGESDFKLFDKSVSIVISRFNEESLFLRGLYRWIGFRQMNLNYEAAQRNAGSTNYSVTKLFKLAVSGITAFSEKPLHIATYLGFLFTLLSVAFFTFDVATSIYYHKAISGWSSIIVAIVFFGGMQMTILGIIGLYIGKIFKQVKDRPNYIIRSKNI